MIKYGLASALIALALGSAIADIFSTGCLAVLCLLDSRIHLRENVSSVDCSPDYSTIKRLLSITLPIAVAAYARSGLIAWEHSLIPRGLQQFGMNHASALASYGQVQSMALPVILFPCALLWSFAGLLVPEVTEAHVRGERKRIQFMMQKVFSLTLVFAIGTSGIIIAFSEELGHTLYQNSDVARIIRILAPLIPVMYLDSATDAMLKGLGQQVYSMKVNIIDSLLSVALVWLLIPRTGISGYIATIYISELVNAGMSIVRLLNLGEMKAHIISWVAKPVLCIIGATCIGRIVYVFLPTSLESIASLVYLISIVIILYMMLLIAIGTIKKNELHWLGSFIIKSQKSRTE
jgi:stage V sporulation protein B